MCNMLNFNYLKQHSLVIKLPFFLYVTVHFANFNLIEFIRACKVLFPLGSDGIRVLFCSMELYFILISSVSF